MVADLTTFILIRHAVHTLAEGTLAGRLANLPIRAIYSSPLERTRQTAAPLAAQFDLPVQIDDAFGEIEFGEWAGKRFDDLAGDPRWNEWNSFRSSSPLPHGGLMLEIQLRAVAALQRLCQAHPDQMVAVVSHSDVIKAAVAHYLGVHLDLFQRIEISPASVSMVAVYGWGARAADQRHRRLDRAGIATARQRGRR